jgi:O-methyltransferase
MITRIVKALARRMGYELTPIMPLSPDETRVIEMVSPFTMTSKQRLLGVIDAVRYVCRAGISGDIVECGVWKGGSMMAAAATLLAEGDSNRNLYLFDTFEGMAPPTDRDRDLAGNQAAAMHEKIPKWCYAGIEEVKRNLLSTGYPAERLHFIPGKVEETLPHVALNTIAVLRLDTDWYESTRHEMIHLFPLLVERGVLIIDDFGHWQGAREAVEEYFHEHPEYALLLQRTDYTARMAVKVRR